MESDDPVVHSLLLNLFTVGLPRRFRLLPEPARRSVNRLQELFGPKALGAALSQKHLGLVADNGGVIGAGGVDLALEELVCQGERGCGNRVCGTFVPRAEVDRHLQPHDLPAPTLGIRNSRRHDDLDHVVHKEATLVGVADDRTSHLPAPRLDELVSKPEKGLEGALYQSFIQLPVGPAAEDGRPCAEAGFQQPAGGFDPRSSISAGTVRHHEDLRAEPQQPPEGKKLVAGVGHHQRDRRSRLGAAHPHIGIQ